MKAIVANGLYDLSFTTKVANKIFKGKSSQQHDLYKQPYPVST